MNLKRLSLLLITICIAALPNAAFAGSAQSQGSLDCEVVVSQAQQLNAYSIFTDELLVECTEPVSDPGANVCTVLAMANTLSVDPASTRLGICTNSCANVMLEFYNYPPSSLEDAQSMALTAANQKSCTEQVPVIDFFPPMKLELP